MSALLWLSLVSLALSFVLTGAVRRYALARGVIDLPGARSSHTQPTPRGAGVAVTAAFLFTLTALGWLDMLDPHLQWALIGASLPVCAIGFIDDHRHVAAHWRLITHGAAAIWAIWALGGMPTLSLFGIGLAPSLIGSLLGAIGLAWLLNLYNFMDGIDTLAGVEALTTALGGALLLWLTGRPEQAAPALLLAAASAGFLLWNLPPARIFLGDSGSGLMGIALGVMALHAAHSDPAILWGWLILLGVFVTDTTATLLRRLLRGETIWHSHCSHAYQHLARRWKSHGRVSAAVLAINLLWLLPCALLVVIARIDAGWGVLLAYAPLVALGLSLGAGRAED
ncbi:MAG: glycosyltransferase family 4 protein [Pseudazoarcus pumilus]|nr:glycosyltransferase family 4 protein [Pseudazoarcus pumilus]